MRYGILLVVETILSTAAMNIEEDDYSATLASCIAILGSQEIRNSRFVWLMDETDDSKMSSHASMSINQHLHIPVVASKLDHNLEGHEHLSLLPEKAETILYIAEKEENIIGTFQQAINSSILYRRSKYFILLLRTNPRTDNLYILLEESWSLQIRNMVLLFINDKEQGYQSIDVFSYNPFLQEDHNGAMYKVFSIGFDSCAEYKLQVDLFPDKMKNLHGYYMKSRSYSKFPDVLFDEETIGTRPYEKILKGGLDVNTLMLAAEYMNFTIYNRDSMWAVDASQVPWNPGMTHIVYGESDIFLNAMPLYLHDVSAMDFTVGVAFFPLSFAVPVPLMVPHWKSMMTAFEPDVWAGIASTGLVTTLVLMVTLYLHRSKEKYLNYTDSFLYTFSMSLLVNAHKPETIPVRMIFTFFTYFSIVICAIYQGNISRTLTVPSYYPLMTSLDDVANSGLHVKSYPMHEEVIKESENLAMRAMYKRYKTDEDVAGILERVAKKGDVVLYEPKVFLEYMIVDQNLYQNGRCLVHIVQQPVIVHQVSYYLTKGSPFTPKINFIIRIVQETGIRGKWFKDLMQDMILNHKVMQKSATDEVDKIVLALNHLEPAFYIMLVGHILSFLAFLGEYGLVCVLRKKSSSVA